MRQNLREMRRTLALGAGVARWTVTSRVARVAAKFRNRRQIISAWPEGEIALGPRVAIFMHFDRYGRVSAPALHYMRELAGAGYRVVFVTNSGMLAPAGEAMLRAVCAAIFVRRNTGYDFGAWADAIAVLGLPRAETREVVILNDSMYGPLRPLDEMLAQVKYDQADIWGLTDSWQFRYHLQSFFLAFGERALRAPAFTKFWDEVIPAPSKAFIIREYEIGFTQKMLKAGLKCRAIWPYEVLVGEVAGGAALDGLVRAERNKAVRQDPLLVVRKLQTTRIRAAAARQVALNPTADLWRQLLMGGFPFIKRELLRKNPSKVEDIGDWVNVVQGELGLDPEPILGELRGGLKNRAP